MIKNGDVVKYITEKNVFGVVVARDEKLHVRYFYSDLSPFHKFITYYDMKSIELLWEKVCL